MPTCPVPRHPHDNPGRPPHFTDGQTEAQRGYIHAQGLAAGKRSRRHLNPGRQPPGVGSQLPQSHPVERLLPLGIGPVTRQEAVLWRMQSSDHRRLAMARRVTSSVPTGPWDLSLQTGLLVTMRTWLMGWELALDSKKETKEHFSFFERWSSTLLGCAFKSVITDVT